MVMSNNTEKREFVLTIFSENKVDLLGQITSIFTYHNVNIESLTTSESAIAGIHKFTIVVCETAEKVERMIKQVEKRVDILKAFVYEPEDVVMQEIALYKVALHKNVEQLVRKYQLRILEISDDYIVIEKTGHKNETAALFEELKPYGVYQFVRSGSIAVAKTTRSDSMVICSLSIRFEPCTISLPFSLYTLPTIPLI